jgi:protein disulfide-isomerase-like protein
MISGVIVLCLSFFIQSIVSSKVTILNDTNFDENLAEGVWLVKFYAPWCKHCKTLDPVFEELSEKADGAMKLGSLDATKNEKISKQFDVNRFPTIMYKRDGKFGTYDGARTFDGFMSFIARALRPSIKPIKDIDSDEMDDLYEHNDNVTFLMTVSNQVVAGLNDKELALHERSVQSFEKVATLQQFHASFASREINGNIEGFAGKSLIISKVEKNRPFEHMDIVTSSSYSVEEVQQFVSSNNHPLVNVFDNHNFKRLSHLNRTMLVLALDYRNKETMTEIVSSLDRVLSNRKIEDGVDLVPVVCGHLDTVRWDAFIRRFHAIGPAIIIIDFHTNPDDADPLYSTISLSNVTLADMDSFLLTDVLNPLQDGTMEMGSPPKGFVKDMWYKIKALYPWSLLLFLVPVVLVASTLFTAYPQEMKIKRD